MSWNPVFVMRELLNSLHFGTDNPRGFVGYVPQDTPIPYYRISSIAGQHREHMQGPSGSAQKRIQVDWWDTDPERLNRITEAARIRLGGLRGAVAIQGEEFQIRRLHMEDSDTDAEPQGDASGVPIYHDRQEWRMDYEEEI